MAFSYDLAGFIVAVIILCITTYWLIKSLIVISRFLQLSEFVAGFIFLAIGTSLPELIIAITSAIDGVPSLSLGNVFGANILDLTLVIGIPILIVRGITLRQSIVKHDTYIMLGMIILPILLMLLGNTLSRIDGILLLLSFGLYVRWMFKQKNSFSKPLKNHVTKNAAALHFTIFCISLFILFVSAKYTIYFAESIAIAVAIPKIFIGVFILSLGTTLPELATATRSALSGYNDFTAGTIIGTVITNSSLILGVAATITPIQANMAYFKASALSLLVCALIFNLFTESGNKLDTREGLALVIVYILFLITMLGSIGIVL